MLKPAILSENHEEIFIARYRRLMASAQRLVEGRRSAAEDLVQDAFIQFTVKRPDLNSIESVDDYLFATLRNLHISQIRRVSQSQTTQLLISDYDNVQMGLRLLDPHRHLQAREDLRRVCEYVAQRKETSKAGSVLILRFFLNYFPSEIGKVLRLTSKGVEVWLLYARRELRAFLADRAALKSMRRQKNGEKVVRLFAPPDRQTISADPADLVSSLREMIFRSRQGECLSRDEWCNLYAPERTESIKSSLAAHLVSCAKCLDTINQILDLPTLAERIALATIGSTEPPVDNGGPSDGGFSSGGAGDPEIGKRLRYRRRETLEHRPQELRIAVNGFFVGAQKVGLPLNELTLKLNLEEKISFIEIFSEQGVLLSQFRVTPPTEGELEQREAVEFSGGRALEIGVNFEAQWPIMHMVYQDPLAQKVQDQASGFEVAEGLTEDTTSVVSNLTKREPATAPRLWRAALGGLLSSERQAKAYRTSAFWLQPATITAVVAVLAIALVAFLWKSKPAAPLTASDVLQRAAQAEDVAAANLDTVTHRTFQLEERRGSVDGDVIASQRVDLWQSAAKGFSTRRLYDSSGRLVSGEWVNKDNVVTLYHHGAKPQVQLRNPQSVIDKSEFWQISPSAKDFVALIGNPQNVRIEERANHYFLTFENGPATTGHRLVQATLVLGRDDLHPVEQTLVVQEQTSDARGRISDGNYAQGDKGGSQLRYFRIRETSFERRPLSAVAPAVFEPEPELLEVDAGARGHGDTEMFSASPLLPASAPVLATAELEVEVLGLLNNAGGDLSDLVAVTRTGDGRLQVAGTVANANRKAEVLHALSSVANHPAVKISVETIAEAEERQRQSGPGNPTTIELQQVQIAKAALPVELELRRHLADKGFSSDQLDQEVTRFASRIMRRSLQTRLFARTLKQTLNRFSPDDLRALTPEARQKLSALVREQAANLLRELAGLRTELQSIVPDGAASGEQIEIDSDADLLRAINRLGELVSHTDEAIRASFSLSAEGSGSASVKDAQFWRSLKSAENLARGISKQ